MIRGLFGLVRDALAYVALILCLVGLTIAGIAISPVLIGVALWERVRGQPILRARGLAQVLIPHAQPQPEAGCSCERCKRVDWGGHDGT